MAMSAMCMAMAQRCVAIIARCRAVIPERLMPGEPVRPIKAMKAAQSGGPVPCLERIARLFHPALRPAKRSGGDDLAQPWQVMPGRARRCHLRSGGFHGVPTKSCADDSRAGASLYMGESTHFSPEKVPTKAPRKTLI
jgi:hypothetical protein